MTLRENIDLYPPGAFSRTWTVYSDAARSVPQDLTGWGARAQVRTDVTPDGLLLGEFGITISGSTVTITASGAVVMSWLAGWRRRGGAWDLVLVAPDGSLYPPLVGGRATIHPNVSM